MRTSRLNQALAGIALGIATTSCGGPSTRAASPPPTTPDPPLERVSLTPQLLPTPFPPFENLSAQERAVVARQLERETNLEVHLLPTMFELCGATDVKSVRTRLKELFRNPTDFEVEEGCRSMSGLTAFGAENRLKPEFVRGAGVDVTQLWLAIVGAFQKSCDAELNSGSRKVDGAVRSFESFDRRVSTTGFSGIVIKERLRLKLENAERETTGVPKDFLLIVESSLYWRRESASEWNLVETSRSLDPRLLQGTPSTPLDQCCYAIVKAVATP